MIDAATATVTSAAGAGANDVRFRKLLCQLHSLTQWSLYIYNFPNDPVSFDFI